MWRNTEIFSLQYYYVFSVIGFGYTLFIPRNHILWKILASFMVYILWKNRIRNILYLYGYTISKATNNFSLKTSQIIGFLYKALYFHQFMATLLSYKRSTSFAPKNSVPIEQCIRWFQSDQCCFSFPLYVCACYVEYTVIQSVRERKLFFFSRAADASRLYGKRRFYGIRLGSFCNIKILFYHVSFRCTGLFFTYFLRHTTFIFYFVR